MRADTDFRDQQAADECTPKSRTVLTDGPGEPDGRLCYRKKCHLEGALRGRLHVGAVAAGDMYDCRTSGGDGAGVCAGAQSALQESVGSAEWTIR